MVALEQYGWNEFHQSNFNQQSRAKEQHPGRILSIKGFKYIVITAHRELECELAGRLLYGADGEDLPKVGDWVCYLAYDTSSGYIVETLPRQNALSRKNPGKKTERQILATNIDYAMVVQGLDRDFNLMRLERYLSQITACKITPIIVLNKSDLATDTLPYRQQVESLQRNCAIYFCSTYNGDGIRELSAAFHPCRSYIMIGSSGVGKSSLLNSLMQAAVQKTNVVSDFNTKGKHTTTTRDLFQLPNGSLLIDSPGMREFGFTSEDGSDQSMIFPGISELVQGCHFPDCIHVNEPGCAVLEALNTGKLEPTIYDTYIKQMKEQRRFHINAEDKKRLNKQFGKLTKEAKNFRKKHKY
jgi:ribosome biogenesis GTPase